jgi:hypothetical protein
MYWTLELASYLEDAPWPASKDYPQKEDFFFNEDEY